MCKNDGWINTESNSYNLWRQKSFLMNCLPRNETIDHLINQSIDHRLMNQSIDQQMIWAWLICTFAAFSSKMAQAHFGDIFHTLGLNIAGPPIFDQITSFSLKIYLRSDDLLIWAQMSRFISQMICDKIFSRSFHVHTYMHIYVIRYMHVSDHIPAGLTAATMHIHLIFACKMYIHDMWSDIYIYHIPAGNYVQYPPKIPTLAKITHC